MSSIFNNLRTLGDAVVGGNLIVSGDHTQVSSSNVSFSDNHLYLNKDYTNTTGQTAGLVANYLPTATTDTVAGAFTAGVDATSNPTVVTTGAATFTAGDIIQISGADDDDNNGLFEVKTHAANLLTIRGVGTTTTVEDFTQTQFTADTTAAGSITKINVSIIRTNATGDWEVGKGSTTGIVFNGASATDHGALNGLTDDDHTQYALLDGRGGGQVWIGGTGTGEGITITPNGDDEKGTIAFTGTDNSTTSTSGSVTVAGGMGVVSDVFVGGSVNVDALDSIGAAMTLSGSNAITVNMGTDAATTAVNIGNANSETRVDGFLTHTLPLKTDITVESGAGPFTPADESALVPVTVFTNTGNVVYTLPQGTVDMDGLVVTFVHGATAGTKTINPNNTTPDTIDGTLATLVLTTQHDRISLMYVHDQNVWYIV